MEHGTANGRLLLEETERGIGETKALVKRIIRGRKSNIEQKMLTNLKLKRTRKVKRERRKKMIIIKMGSNVT